MIPLSLPDATGVKPDHFSRLVCGLGLLALLHIGYLAGTLGGVWMAGPAETGGDGATRHIIGAHTLQIPDEYVSASATGMFGSTRSVSASNSLSIAARWPDMAPANSPRSSTSAGVSRGDLLRIDIRSAETGAEPLQDTLDPVYRRLAIAQDMPGPAGLKILSLPVTGANEIDEIVYEAGQRDGFAARCKRESSVDSLICERDMILHDTLMVTYRFERPLLASWGRLDRRVQDLVLSYMSRKTGQLNDTVGLDS